jgi:hypothetical protein
LVKRREKRHHENLLHEQFLKTVRYLNEFRKHGRKIDYISFDVAKCNKVGQVIPKLDQLGLKIVLKNGWFQVIFNMIQFYTACFSPFRN